MKKAVVVLMLLLVALYAANKNNTQVQTVLPKTDDDRIQTMGTPVARPNTVNPNAGDLILGRQEVIGYTTLDWQLNGAIDNRCHYDATANGIHCLWMWSAGAPATDRNERYNFYDFATHAWNWPDGINVYTTRSGFGAIDYNPISGCAYTATHQGSTGAINSYLARDQAPGAGLFEYHPALTALEWPYISVDHNQAAHVAAINCVDQDSLWYARSNPWGTWSTPIRIPSPGASPMFPTQNIAASKTSNKVIIVWNCSDDPYPERAFYRLSTDGGVTWNTQTQIPFPPSINMTPAYNVSSLFAMFDAADNFHIVASVAETSFTIPAEIWHYCPTNTPRWTLVHRYDHTGALTASPGYNALFATRPSIIQDQTDPSVFYVAWEQFDSLNYEPITNLARSEICLAQLTNNGTTVARKSTITDPNTTSKRFPCVGGIKDDTIFVMYIIDSIAGFENYTQGPATRNPVILHRVYKNDLHIVTGVEENQTGNYHRLDLISATPNPSNLTTNITYSLNKTADINLTIYDVLGRPIRTLVSGTRAAGEYNIIWDGRDANGRRAQAGIYFYTMKTCDKSISRKLIRTN